MLARRLDRQPCLADTARADQCHESGDGFCQQLSDVCELGLPADKWCGLDGQVVALDCARRRSSAGVLRPSTGSWLRRRFEAGDGSMLIPKWNGKMQMLCAGYSASLLPRIAERIRTGQIDLRGLASTESTQIIEEEELRRSYPGEPLMNVNTPEELETARRLDGQGKE